MSKIFNHYEDQLHNMYALLHKLKNHRSMNIVEIEKDISLISTIIKQCAPENLQILQDYDRETD